MPKTPGPRAKILECRAQNECRVNAPWKILHHRDWFPSISSKDLEVLYAANQLGLNAPESFVNSAWFNTIFYFGKRLRKERPWKPTRDKTRWPLAQNNNKPVEVLHLKRESDEKSVHLRVLQILHRSVFHRCKFWDGNTFLSSQVFEQCVGIYGPKAPSFRVFDPRGVTRINFTWQLVKFAPITVEIKLDKPIKFAPSRQSRTLNHSWLFYHVYERFMRNEN